MKKTVCVLAAFVVVALGLFLFGDSSGRNDLTSEPASSNAGSRVEGSPSRHETEDTESSGPAADDDSSLTRDEFDQLSQERQDEMLEEFVLDFWERELGLAETTAEERNLSLEIFNRPYMLTLTEREYLQLSPEDREKADAEIGENCRQIRSHVLDTVAEAESLIANRNYLVAEAYLVHILEMGRELTVNKEGMCLTRLVGISCENRALNGLVKLYTQTGDDSRVQMAREQMSENQEEIKEIAKIVQQSEPNN